MKRCFSFIFLAFIALASCNQEISTSKKKNTLLQKPDMKAEIAKLNKILEQYDEKSQTFRVSGSQTSEVVGKAGTVLYINPANLETESGQAVQDSIEVELKELMNQSQLLKANAQTVSNGKLLVSGGAYYINLKSKGQNLQLKKDKTLQVVFRKIAKEEMSLFYGEQDSLETVNWSEAKQTLSSNRNNELPLTDTMPRISRENSQVFEKIYEPVELKRLGWINCDRFYEIPEKDKTNVSFTFSPKDSVACAKVFLVFQDINSLMEILYRNAQNSYLDDEFRNIPINRKVKLIAITQKDNATYCFEKDFNIKANEKINIKLSKYTQKQLDRLLK